MQSSLVAVSSEYLYENHLSMKIRDLRHDIVILQDTYYNEDRRTGGDCMRNHEVTQRHPLLDEHGRLKEAGWSRSLLQEYRREDIKAKRWRIKEWLTKGANSNVSGFSLSIPLLTAIKRTLFRLNISIALPTWR